MDFTLSIYKKLLTTYKDRNYRFFTVEEFFPLFHPVSKPTGHPIIIMRHDVDRTPQNALQIATIEYELNIKSSYYFRILPCSYNSKIIREIAELGHEIGYHYENMSTCHGDLDKAWDDFRRNLEKLRKLYPVNTICMHGSPMSKYDNRDLWKKYDYSTEGIIGEPYLDVDWNEVFYLTDTGRRWDGGDVSIRDKIQDSRFKIQDWPVYRTTNDIIAALKNGTFPKKAMITTHPQRWTNNPILWTKELVWQNIKNRIKSVVVRRLK